MLRHTPKQIWAGESGSVTFLRDCKRKQRLTTVQLFPLLLKSLVFNDAALKLATLEVIQVLMKDSPQIIAEHISSVVPSLLKMTIPKDQQGAENSIVSYFLVSMILSILTI